MCSSHTEQLVVLAATLSCSISFQVMAIVYKQVSMIVKTFSLHNEDIFIQHCFFHRIYAKLVNIIHLSLL